MNVLADQIGAQIERELPHERLGRAIDIAARIGIGAGDRAEVDNMAMAISTICGRQARVNTSAP